MGHVAFTPYMAGMQSSDVKVAKILKWMHYLLKDSPARQQIYEEVTGAGTRWCESEICAKRAAEIWTDYTKFIQHLTSLNKSAQLTGKSFDGLKAIVNTPLMCARFRFYETLSWKLNEYLRGFQNDKPMLPFVQEELESLL